MKLGFKIKKIREIKGLKQEYLAEMLGLSQQRYSQLEQGNDEISLARLQKIADILQVKLEDIINYDEGICICNNTNSHSLVINSHINDKSKEVDGYEKYIKLLEEQVKSLREENENLKSRVKKLPDCLFA